MAFFLIKKKFTMFKWLEKNLPKIVMAPAVGLIGWFVYGFVLWTLYISFTNSKILPKYELWGFGQYEKLWASRKWLISVDNLLVFTALFLIFCIVIGIILAIFLDQKIRAEGVLRTIYLYPMALSFIVTGTAWKWILNPTLGIQKMFIDWGFENFTFDWLVNREMAIYTIVIAGVWQSAGFVMALFLIFCIVIGIILAIFLDQKIRAEGVLRTIYLYPMALSFIVTGTAWKWILNPTLGIQKMFIDWGFENFTFDWLVNREMAIYTIVIAGVWQSAGFVMALFLAGLRSVEDEIVKAAKIDGAGLFTVYWKILLPMMRPVFFTSFVILVHISIKSYDLIVALTQGGPGISTTMPALFMTQAAFHKSQVGLSAASAMMMFMAVAAVIIPYLYSELRRENAR